MYGPRPPIPIEPCDREPPAASPRPTFQRIRLDRWDAVWILALALFAYFVAR